MVAALRGRCGGGGCRRGRHNDHESQITNLQSQNTKHMSILIPDGGRPRLADLTEAAAARGEAGKAVAVMVALYAEIEAWRKSRGFSDVKFCELFPMAGDRRTFASWREEPEAWDRSVETWLPKYRQLRAALRDYDAQTDEPPALVFGYVQDFDAGITSLRSRRNEKRVLWVEGAHGAGKTALLNRLAATVGKDRVVTMHGRQSWRSLGVMLEDMLRALGHPVPERKRPESAARLQGKLSAALLERNDALLVIDEAHRIHGAGMNVLIDLVNDMARAGNMVHFVGAALPGVWDTMTERYALESQQLRRRFCDLVAIPEPDAEQCRMIVGQRLDTEGLAGVAGWAEMLAGKARRCGQRSFVADVGDSLAKMKTVTAAKFAAVMAAVVRKNGEKAL